MYAKIFQSHTSIITNLFSLSYILDIANTIIQFLFNNVFSVLNYKSTSFNYLLIDISRL